jgi:tetratricopeptide (TPR) repeat protein
LVNTNSTNEKKKEDISILTLQSIILKYLLKLKESKVLLKKIVELNDQSQEYLHWTVCYYILKMKKVAAHCELAEILFHQKKYKESKEMFEKADAFSVYDWEENGFMFIRIKASLIKLNELIQKEESLSSETSTVTPTTAVVTVKGVKKLSLLKNEFVENELAKEEESKETTQEETKEETKQEE